MVERNKYVMLDYDKIKTPDGRDLHRIKAIKNFADVKYGDLGGYIEKTENLSQHDDCWLYGPRCGVWDDAVISGSAKLTDHSVVFGKAKIIAGEITNGEMIQDNAYIRGNRDHTCIFNVIENENITFYRNVDGDIALSSKDFHGNMVDFPAWLNVNVSKEVKTIYLYALAYAIAKFNAYDMAEDFVNQFDSSQYTLMRGDVNKTINDVNGQLYMRGDINGMIGEGPVNNSGDAYEIFNNDQPKSGEWWSSLKNPNFGLHKERY